MPTPDNRVWPTPACQANQCTREQMLGARLLDLMPAHEPLGLIEDYARVHDLWDAVDVAEKVRTEVNRPMEIRGIQIQVGVSIGVSVSERGADPERVMHDADVALYRAKQPDATGSRRCDSRPPRFQSLSKGRATPVGVGGWVSPLVGLRERAARSRVPALTLG